MEGDAASSLGSTSLSETLDAGRTKGLSYPRPGWTEGHGRRAFLWRLLRWALGGGVCPQNAVQLLGPTIYKAHSRGHTYHLRGHGNFPVRPASELPSSLWGSLPCLSLLLTPPKGPHPECRSFPREFIQKSFQPSD